ncbi:MAG: SCO6880 family protein, partial [Acidimicrobiales bacterium]
MSDAGRTYRFHPLERRGIVLGLGPAHLGTLAVGAVTAFAAIQAGGGLLAAGALLALAAALALVPVEGRSVVDWAPVGARWLAGAAAPVRAPAGRSASPPGVRLLAAPATPGDGDLGVVHDRRSGAWAAVVPVEGPPFSLLDADDKHRQLAAWGAVLASTCRPSSPVHRIQWVQRARPADLDGVRAHLATGRVQRAAPAALRGYGELLASAAGGAGGHEVLLVVTVHPRRAGRQLRTFGPGRGAVCGLLRRELRLLAGQLRRAGIEPAPPLDLPGLAAAIRRGYEPAAGARPRPGGHRSAWPVAWRDGWAAAHVDGRWHAVSWVAEWPRAEVGPDFLAPLLLT